MYLVDTSAWIRHFSRADDFDLRSLCEPDERVLCLPIYQEILQGVREDGSFRQVKGITVRSSVDCLIAAPGIRHGLTVLHWDRDYAALAGVSELRQRSVG